MRPAFPFTLGTTTIKAGQYVISLAASCAAMGFVVVALILCGFHGSSRSAVPDETNTNTLVQQVELLRKQGRRAQALELAQRILVLREQELGRDHLQVGIAAVAVGRLYRAVSSLSPPSQTVSSSGTKAAPFWNPPAPGAGQTGR